mmetsp:Transcript_46958/g.56785  ORF Transcript_46958/g.56785 Transcript_46958/m.56785 type:complete len:147 (+) Transcript_46958:295-735(+)
MFNSPNILHTKDDVRTAGTETLAKNHDGYTPAHGVPPLAMVPNDSLSHTLASRTTSDIMETRVNDCDPNSSSQNPATWTDGDEKFPCAITDSPHTFPIKDDVPSNEKDSLDKNRDGYTPANKIPPLATAPNDPLSLSLLHLLRTSL